MHLERPLPFIPDFLDLIPTPLIFLLEARQYCKDMQWLGNHRGHMDAAATSVSVAVLVGQMQAELRDLMSRREDLVRRIRYLCQVTRSLREIPNAPALPHRCAESPSPAASNSVAASISANRAAIGVSGVYLQSSTQRETDPVNVHLQRACRIALMEAVKPVSLEEICALIVRRGSFSFVHPERANPVLLQVLNVMAECGEAHLLEGAPCSRWERMSPWQEA